MTTPLPIPSELIPELPPELALAGFDLFLSLAVIAGLVSLYALYLTLRPLFESGNISSEEWARLEDDSLNLLRKRDRVIAELKDLEFEAAMDKFDDHDLAQLRRQYKREALSLIEQLEESERAYLGDRAPSAQQAAPVKGSSDVVSLSEKPQSESLSENSESADASLDSSPAVEPLTPPPATPSSPAIALHEEETSHES